MRTKLFAFAAISALSLAATPTARAQFIGSSISILADNGLGGNLPGNSCKNVTKTTTVAGGGEVIGSDWTGGCVGFYAVDMTNTALTFTVLQGGNYDFADFDVTVLSGGTISGLTFTGYNGFFFDPSYGFNESNFLPTITTRSNGFHISWATNVPNHGTADQFRFLDPTFCAQATVCTTALGDGTATFAIQASVVPEPATLTLLAPGLVGLVGMVRRRKKR